MENGGKNHTTIGSNYIFLNRIGLKSTFFFKFTKFLILSTFFQMASMDRVKSKMAGQKWQIVLLCGLI